MTEAAIISLIVFYSNMFGFDSRVALAVAKVESGYKINAVSKDSKDLGIFQLRQTSYPGYSRKALLNPRINVMLGILHLKRIKESCVHQRNLDYLTCFNLGEAGAKKVKYPHLWKYVKKVNYELNNIYQQNSIAMAGQMGYIK